MVTFQFVYMRVGAETVFQPVPGFSYNHVKKSEENSSRLVNYF